MITHDLGVIAGAADRVAVMYAGKPVETGVIDDVFYRPRMPYTLGLLGSIPRLDVAERLPLTPIEGSPPSLINLPRGCPFTPRCPMRIEKCEQIEPELLVLSASGDGHAAACHRSNEIEQQNLKSTDIFPAPGHRRACGQPCSANSAGNGARTDGPGEALSARQRRDPAARVGTVFAVDGISLDIREGETLGLVGESGCGKTTTIMEVLNLIRPASGRIVVLGKDTAGMSASGSFRSSPRDLNVVFQDPLASLDPRMPVSDILAEPLQTHGVPAAERAASYRRVAADCRSSSGARQPISAGVLGWSTAACGDSASSGAEARLVVLDEPVSALDVSIRAGVINLLEKLRMDFGFAYLFVAHDLSVVRHIADRVAVMYLGKIAEIGEVNRVFGLPAHPYTQALLSAIPLPDPRKERARRRIILKGDIPNPANPPSGCRFRTRCQKFAHELMDQRTRAASMKNRF